MPTPESFAPADAGRTVSSARVPVGLRGWLLVLMVGLVAQAVHGLALTIGSIVIYGNPSLAGVKSSVPLAALLFYVTTNVALAGYTAVVLALMVRRRKAAIIHGIILNGLPVLFLVSWHVLGEKSGVGVVVDSLPGLAGIAYLVLSRRVRGTFTCTRVPAHSAASARVS